MVMLSIQVVVQAVMKLGALAPKFLVTFSLEQENKNNDSVKWRMMLKGGLYWKMVDIPPPLNSSSGT